MTKRTYEELRAMDILITEKVFGTTPREVAIATEDDGESACAWVSIDGPFKSEDYLREWLQEKQSNGLLESYKIGYWKDCDPFSSNRGYAFAIIDKMIELDDPPTLHYTTIRYPDETFDMGWSIHFRISNGVGQDQSLPYAICLAALDAIEKRKKQDGIK